MSTYQSTPHQIAPEQTRPTTLVTAAGAAIGAAVLMIIGAVVILARARDIAVQQVADNTTRGAESVDVSLVDPNSDRVNGLTSIFNGLAADTVFWALALAVLAYFALRGGRATRILSVIILVFSEIVMGINLFLSNPMLVKITSSLAGIAALAAIVLFFLPATNAYGKARRAAKAAGQR